MKICLLNIATIIFMILLVTGCTTQNAYDSLRYHQEQDCQKMQGTDRDACMRRSDMSYDEYQSQLKSLPHK